MTDISVASASFAEREFRVGAVMSEAMRVLSRNVVTFSIVTFIASLPTVLLFNPHNELVLNPATVVWMFAGAWDLSILLSALSQAIILYGAFEAMRGRRVDLMASFQNAWRRFLPVIGAGLFVTFLAGLASLLLIVPGLILLTMWYVAIPACVVEQTGPWKSLSRSAALTKGNRWKVFGMLALLIIISLIGGALIGVLALAVGATLGLLADLILSAVIGAYSAILGVVTYHDLRVAKEGIDTDQIAAVFE